MNKRKSKKQKRPEAVRLLERMHKYECAVLMPDGNGKAIVILGGARITVEHNVPEPYAYPCMLRRAMIEGNVVGIESVV